MNKHRNSSRCWGSQEKLGESKQKLYACRICDKVYKDYKPMVIHILTELLKSGFTVPSENLDLSQCITIIYVEQLYSDNVEITMSKIKELAYNSSDDIFDEIDKLEAQIDDEDSYDNALELVIDLDSSEKMAKQQEKDQKYFEDNRYLSNEVGHRVLSPYHEEDSNTQIKHTKTDKPSYMMSSSLNEFKSSQKFMAVPKNDKIKKKQNKPFSANNEMLEYKIQAGRKKSNSLLLSKTSSKEVQKITSTPDIISENDIDLDDEELPLSSKSKLKSARGSLTMALLSKMSSQVWLIIRFSSF